MIHSFGNRLTEDLYHGVSNAKVRRMPGDIKEPALYKLDILNAVGSLEELRSPPGNRLEALKGYSIRVNFQWRIVFRWQGAGAYEVKIVDYH